MIGICGFRGNLSLKEREREKARNENHCLSPCSRSIVNFRSLFSSSLHFFSLSFNLRSPFCARSLSPSPLFSGYLEEKLRSIVRTNFLFTHPRNEERERERKHRFREQKPFFLSRFAQIIKREGSTNGKSRGKGRKKTRLAIS